MYNISFFSYKGGSGRSSALVNIVPFLAEKLHADESHPIILLDMDVDSTGLTYLLHQGQNANGRLSIQKIMIDCIPGGNNYRPKLQDHPFFSGLLKVGDKFGVKEGAVLLLPAEAGRAVGKDGTNKSITNRDTGHVRKLADLCEYYECAAIIFDSAAGDQEAANVCNSNADIIVCCMRPTLQFQEGTLDYFRRMSYLVNNRDVILLPNAVSREDVDIDGEMYPISAKNRLVDAFMKAFPETGNAIHLDALLAHRFGIPIVQRFLWRETILAVLDNHKLTEDEKEALEMYEYIASLILKYGVRGI